MTQDNQDFYPYGLKSMVECVSRAILLAQPDDISDFVRKYLSEMIDFRDSHSEADPKIVCFSFQEDWEKNFLRNREFPITATGMSATSPTVPSKPELEEVVKTVYSGVEPSAKKKVVNFRPCQRGGRKIPAATSIQPTPPPRVGRNLSKNRAKPLPPVQQEGKPAPPQRDGSVKTRRVSSVRISNDQQRKTTADDAKKTAEAQRRTLPPVPKQPLKPKDASPAKPSAASKPSKAPGAVPPVSKGVPLKPGKGSPHLEKQAAKPSPSVKEEKKPAAPPRDGSVKTRGVSSVRSSNDQQRKTATDDAKKTGEAPRRRLPPVPKQPSKPKDASPSKPSAAQRRTLTPVPKRSSKPKDASPSKPSAARKPAKPPTAAAPVKKEKDVVSPGSRKTTRGRQESAVQGKSVPPKPRKGSPKKKEVASEKTGSGSPSRRAPAKKAKAETKTAKSPVRKPKSAAPKLKEPKKAWSTSPDRVEKKRVLWTERERVKPVLGKPANAGPGPVSEGASLAPIGSHGCPHPHVTHILRYSRMQVLDELQRIIQLTNSQYISEKRLFKGPVLWSDEEGHEAFQNFEWSGAYPSCLQSPAAALSIQHYATKGSGLNHRGSFPCPCVF